ncbi:adenine phosphoribosyltransferase-like isoform X1 [Columba livia]|uniref:adenine phosphoribosyltransferase-like isoform X1 n=1 Tax=Columba livia TaxID=8932 RepID=UPI0031BA2A36
MLPVLFLVLVLGAGDTHAGREHPCPGAPTTQQPGRDSRARLGTLLARRQHSCLAPAQGPAGQGCWRVLGAAGAVPAQLSLSVTLPVTVPLGSAPPPAYPVLAVPEVPTHGPVPRPRHPGEGLVPGADGSQCQGSKLRLAGPLPALLPPASTQHPGQRAPVEGLQDCVADLLQPFQGDPIDMVAGIDAMGFILGAAAATTLRKGFLAIRKAGHLCVQTLEQPYSDYSGREKVMEVRTDTISPGLRILLVDQWVETGGTMRAAIQLVERLGGVVAGVAAICIEDSEGGRWIQERYKCSHCVPPRLQPRFNRHQLGWE